MVCFCLLLHKLLSNKPVQELVTYRHLVKYCKLFASTSMFENCFVVMNGHFFFQLKDLKRQLQSERKRAEKLQERLQEVLSEDKNRKCVYLSKCFTKCWNRKQIISILETNMDLMHIMLDTVNSPIKAPLPIKVPPVFCGAPRLNKITFLAISQPKMVRFSFCEKPLEAGNVL